MSARTGARQARATLIKLLVFTILMVLVMAGLIVVFSEYRSRSTRTYHAEFSDVSGIKDGAKVRIAGVEVGKVAGIDLLPGNRASVEFTAADDQTVHKSTIATIRYENLTGDRYLELSRGTGDQTPLEADGTLPEAQTRPALDLDALLGGFKPLFKALDPAQVNELSRSIVQIFQGESGNVQDLLAATSSLTRTLADRDQLIGSVIDNLNSVLHTVDDNRSGVDSVVDNLQQLISGLAESSKPIGESVTRLADASGSMTVLLSDVRPSLQRDVAGLDEVGKLMNDDEPFVENVISRLPADFEKMQRLGTYGSFFQFYLCGVIIQFSENGTSGKTKYFKEYEQTSGRCEAK